MKKILLLLTVFALSCSSTKQFKKEDYKSYITSFQRGWACGYVTYQFSLYDTTINPMQEWQKDSVRASNLYFKK